MLLVGISIRANRYVDRSIDGTRSTRIETDITHGNQDMYGSKRSGTKVINNNAKLVPTPA